LIESDVADGKKVIIAPTTVEDSAICPQLDNQEFAIVAPYLTPEEVIDSACIVYDYSNGQLVRTGPEVLKNGSLDYSSTATNVVGTGIQVSDVAVNSTGTLISMRLQLAGFLGFPAKSYTVSYGTKNLKVGS
jgi:hypothetical protein